jgi:hypothetical protein
MSLAPGRIELNQRADEKIFRKGHTITSFKNYDNKKRACFEQTSEQEVNDMAAKKKAAKKPAAKPAKKKK